MESKTEKLMKVIRQTPMFRQLIPQEAGVGWPIPRQIEDKVYVILPFFGFAPTGEGEDIIAEPTDIDEPVESSLDSPVGKKIKLYPPFATITLDWSNLLPVEYVNLRYRNPAPELQWEGQVGTFPHREVERMKIGQYKEKRRELLAMYDEMFETLSQDNTFMPAWCTRFEELLRTLMEPSLEPYYRAFAPQFFNRFLGEKSTFVGAES